MPQPTFALSQPLRLAVQDNRPIYQRVQHLLAGAHRVEGGWWDRTSCVESSNHDGASAADAGPETSAAWRAWFVPMWLPRSTT